MHTLRLEAIGDDLASLVSSWRDLGPHFSLKPRRPWVAEITGWRGGRWYDREFLGGHKDFSQANGKGSRGVYLYYHLAEGHIYEVRELISWSSDRRYFCAVRDGSLVELSVEEVQAAMTERAEREAGLA